MLRVEIRLHAGLLKLAPEGARRGTYQLEFADGSRVRDVLASVGVPSDRRVIVGIDGQAASADDALYDGALIDLVPPIAGGAW